MMATAITKVQTILGVFPSSKFTLTRLHEPARLLELLTPKILNTPIPPLALSRINVGPKPPTLGELVLRFLEAQATDTYIKLVGGIGLSS